MKTIHIKVSDTDYQRYNLDSEEEIKFSDLVERISLEYARKALLDCNQIAQQVGLAGMTMEEIDEEVKAVRNAKVILDTNVIVSALISNAVPTRILYDLVLKQLVLPCLSSEVFEEYVEILGRSKFSKFPDFISKADVVLTKLKEISTIYKPNKTVDLLTDTSDNKFLELAAVSSADYLITGNTLDFTINEFEYTKIVTPRDYFDNYWPTPR